MSYIVYAHINKTNGKIYIGQTCQTAERRWRADGSGYKPGSYFYNAIQKYGWDGFEHEVIASNLTLEEANNFETLLIEKLNTTNRNFGYNSAFGGGNRAITQETKEKISEGLKKTDKNKGLNHWCAKAIGQYDKKGNFIKEWSYIREAAQTLGIQGANISACAKGRRKTAGGYIWRYMEEVSQDVVE